MNAVSICVTVSCPSITPSPASYTHMHIHEHTQLDG